MRIKWGCGRFYGIVAMWLLCGLKLMSVSPAAYMRTVIINPQEGAFVKDYSGLPARASIHCRLMLPPSVHMGRIVKVRIFKDYYYAMDESRTLFVFNEAGECLNTISEGQPYSFLRPYDFEVDKEGLSLVILDERGWLSYLTPDGKHVKQTSLRLANEQRRPFDIESLVGKYGDGVWKQRQQLVLNAQMKGFLIEPSSTHKDVRVPLYRLVFGKDLTHTYNEKLSQVTCFDSDEALYVEFVYCEEKYCFFLDKLTETHFLYRPRTIGDCLIDTDGHRHIFISYQSDGTPTIHILRMNWTVQATNQKQTSHRRIFLMVVLVLSIALVLVVMVSVLFYWHNRRILEHRPQPIVTRQSDENNARKAPASVQRDVLLKDLQSELADVAASWPEWGLINDDGQQYASQCRSLLHMENDEAFRDYLDSRLDGFMIRLQMAYPHLSQNDLQLSALLLLGLDNRQIAWIKNVKFESIYTSRQRLAKRIGLKSTSTLVLSLQRFYEDTAREN